MAIIGISSIHLLKTFIEVGDLGAPNSQRENLTGEVYTSEGVLWQVVIHTVFILSAIALAFIDRMSQAAGAKLPPSAMGGKSARAAGAALGVAGPAATAIPLGAVVVSGYMVEGKFIQRD